MSWPSVNWASEHELLFEKHFVASRSTWHLKTWRITTSLFPFIVWHKSPTSGQEQLKNRPLKCALCKQFVMSMHIIICQTKNIMCQKNENNKTCGGEIIQLMTKHIINTTQSKRFSRRRACWYDHQNNVMWQIVSKFLLVFSIAPIDDWSLFKETRMWQAPHAMDGGNE